MNLHYISSNLCFNSILVGNIVCLWLYSRAEKCAWEMFHVLCWILVDLLHIFGVQSSSRESNVKWIFALQVSWIWNILLCNAVLFLVECNLL